MKHSSPLTEKARKIPLDLLEYPASTRHAAFLCFRQTYAKSMYIYEMSNSYVIYITFYKRFILWRNSVFYLDSSCGARVKSCRSSPPQARRKKGPRFFQKAVRAALLPLCRAAVLLSQRQQVARQRTRLHAAIIISSSHVVHCASSSASGGRRQARQQPAI